MPLLMQYLLQIYNNLIQIAKFIKLKIDVRVIFLQTKTKLKTLVTRHLAL